jgi:hypothetical protein
MSADCIAVCGSLSEAAHKTRSAEGNVMIEAEGDALAQVAETVAAVVGQGWS